MSSFRPSFLSCALCLAMAVFGCSDSATGDDGDGGDHPDGSGQDGSSNPDGGSDGDSSYSGDRVIPGGVPICGEMNLRSSEIPPNMLIVVDRSGSMARPICDDCDRDKIEDARDALTLLIDEGEGKIRFGWLQYPTDRRCGPGDVSVECGDDTADAIRSRIASLRANGGTPTGDSLNNALAYEGLHDESRGNFVLLLTDGLPTCPTGDGEDATEADAQLALDAVGALKTAGIETFVIGMGEDLNASNPTLLNNMAVAGGRPQDGSIKYYQANSLDQLQTVMSTIGGMVLGCSMSLDPVPEFPAYLWVFFDDETIPRDKDHVNGWDYDLGLNQITFYGPACDRLRSGQVEHLDVVMGCAPPA
jgi:hypothetical protein